MFPSSTPDDLPQLSQATEKLAQSFLSDEQKQVKLDNYVYQGAAMHCERYAYLPQTILDQYDRLECKSFLGILPEINRVYITIDNRLFLFNYNDGSVYAYDDFDQIIISVALITPKPGVFIDEIEYLLVVATTSEIVILGVCFEGGSQSGDIELKKTSYYACSDGVHMLKIVCTPPPSSRIFAAGKDGRVYEIDYSPGSRWFSKKCRKLSHTSMTDKLSVLFPVFSLFRSTDPLVDLIVDDVKCNLYGLSKSSCLFKYELGTGKFDECLGPIITDSSEIKRSLGADAGTDFSIIGLSVHHMFPSSDLCVITNHGHRVFLKSTKGEPLVVESVRICPRYIDAPSSGTIRKKYKPFFSKGQSPSDVRSAIYANGNLLVADMRDPQFDTLIAVSLIKSGDDSLSATASGNTQPMTASADENVESHTLDCRVHDIKAAPIGGFLNKAPLAATLLRNSSSQVPMAGLSPLAFQHAVPAPRFIVLTAARVIIYSLNRPIEQVSDLLNSEHSSSSLLELMKKFGMVESCAMLLSIICCPKVVDFDKPSHSTSQGIYIIQDRRNEAAPERNFTHFDQNQTVRQAAIDAFITFGGESSFQVNSLDHNVTCSFAHNSLYLTTSRLLRSIWFTSLVFRDQHQTQFRLQPQAQSELLYSLTNLYRFISDYQLPKCRQAQAHDFAAGSVELSSTNALHKLISRTIEVLRLCFLLCQSECLPQILQIMDNGDRFTLESSAFKDIMGSGIKCLQSLIRAFMEVEGGLSLVGLLRTSCPSFINASDLYLFNGNQLLVDAKSQRLERKASKLHQDALECFKKASTDIEFPLASVVAKLMERGRLTDVVELCLWRASSLDRSTSSTEFSSEESRLHMQSIALRQKAAYQIICSSLDEAISSTSSAFSQQEIKASLAACFRTSLHSFLENSFFPFYAQKFDSSYDIECQPFQSYLVKHQQFDRLHQYMAALEKFGDGARFFAQLPNNIELSGHHLNIRDRIRFLEIAMELSRHSSVEDHSLKSELRKAVELGEIQSQIIGNLIVEEEGRNQVAGGAPPGPGSGGTTDLSLCLSQLLSGDALYDIACRHNLFEMCLRILFVEDSRQHRDVVAALYSNIISSIIQEKEGHNADWRIAVKEVVSRLGRQYRTSAFMFPASLICNLLEQHNITRAVSPADVTPSFVAPLLVDLVQYPVDQLITIYSRMIEHWSLTRIPLFGSIQYILAPANVDALSGSPLLYSHMVASAADLCEFCLSFTDNPFREQFSRLRQIYLQKKNLGI